ncbi:transcriptional regulator [Arthrobacter sp. V4I6]|uniref:transcriptional regulator n=1 Tax=Arthrobacter sp. V4I6 TaxID=3042281 RepID=UPI0027D7C7DE|nr:transcriptional regulator [Arthrobacter sp. V4I6]
MNEQQTLEALGRLITEAHRDKFPSRRQFALTTGIDVKTITTAEKGERELHPTTQRRLEQALGWRKGSISEVWEHRESLDQATLTIAEMERGAEDEPADSEAAAQARVTRASQLTDEELLAEISYRFRNYKVRLNGES